MNEIYKTEQKTSLVSKYNVLVTNDVKKIDLRAQLVLNSITILVVDGSFELSGLPKDMVEISAETVESGIHMKKYKLENNTDSNFLTVIYLDHHKNSDKFPNQVLQLNSLLEDVGSYISEGDDLILCTPRPDADSATALYRFWVERRLKNFNNEKYDEKLRINRFELFVKALEAAAQWGDTFGFAQNNYNDFSRVELDSIRQIAKYLNRLSKNAEGLQVGIDTLHEIFENFLNGHKFELPLIQKMKYWRMMAKEQGWLSQYSKELPSENNLESNETKFINISIQKSWQENLVSQEYYKKGLIYVDISTLEKDLKSKDKNVVVDAEIVCNAIFNLNLQEEIYPYFIMKRSRETKSGLSYYSFGTIVGHKYLDSFVSKSCGMQCLKRLCEYENIKLETVGVKYFSGRNQAAGTISSGSRLSPNEICSIIVETLVKSENQALKAKLNQGVSTLGPYRDPAN